MEELQTTEALDREILEDARKKAHKILKSADDTLAAQSREWEQKTSLAVESIRKVYAERIKKAGDEILARLPLDKRRLRSEIAEGLLSKAMDDFLKSLPRGTLLAVLERELSARLLDCAGEGFTDDTSSPGAPELVYSGLGLEEARALLEKAFAALPKKGNPAARGKETAGWTFKENAAAGGFPALVINTRALKITASVEAAAASLLKDRRAELARALLGEGALND